MKFAKRFLLLCGVLLLALAGPASAQYMFIDADGNGLPGAGDVMQANGVVTNAAVYLYTNRDRIGTTRTCNDGTSTIDLFAYAVNLEATGGTVDYGTFTTNAAPEGGTVSQCRIPRPFTQGVRPQTNNSVT